MDAARTKSSITPAGTRAGLKSRTVRRRFITSKKLRARAAPSGSEGFSYEFFAEMASNADNPVLRAAAQYHLAAGLMREAKRSARRAPGNRAQRRPMNVACVKM